MTLDEFKQIVDDIAAVKGDPPPILVIYLGDSWVITGEWLQSSDQSVLVLHIASDQPPVYVPISSIRAVSTP